MTEDIVLRNIMNRDACSSTDIRGKGLKVPTRWKWWRNPPACKVFLQTTSTLISIDTLGRYSLKTTSTLISIDTLGRYALKTTSTLISIDPLGRYALKTTSTLISIDPLGRYSLISGSLRMFLNACLRMLLKNPKAERGRHHHFFPVSDLFQVQNICFCTFDFNFDTSALGSHNDPGNASE